MDREEREALGEKVRTALGLHRSMALCGEQATTKSERAFGEGMDALVALLDELAARDALINDLATYAGTKCDNYTGRVQCLEYGRTVDARYEADRACWPCTIRDTIRRALSVRDSEETQ